MPLTLNPDTMVGENIADFVGETGWLTRRGLHHMGVSTRDAKPDYLVYLAGPIAGLTYGESTDWRHYADENLPPHIGTISPMRGKEYLKGGVVGTHAYEQPLSSDGGIVARDRFDVRRADLMLAYFPPGTMRASIGTSVEFGWADAFGTPVMTVVTEGDVHDHPFVRRLSGWIIPDLDEALRLIPWILCP